ncbi:uncharacterized protein LOC128224719 [Mya arenaria]|uniref:uncharacterized protein LOC128224719 n=1 Tax=Mya arenaria TaxID=6604 RepID=UPI0022E95003|nr:uncharacterized protein LOC128224719 [Mya arenaria]
MGNFISKRRRGERSSDEELSVRVCWVLDQLGYSQSMVLHRRVTCKKWEVIGSINIISQYNTTIITAGSKGEGFAAPFESDSDTVLLYMYSVCKTPGDDSLTLPDTHYEFTMDSEHCHPGHFRLELTQSGTTGKSNIQQALFVHDNGKTYISSEKYVTSFIKDNDQTVSGPAITGCSKYSSWDHVNSFRCTSQQQLLSQWINRQRHHNWPTQDLIEEASKLEAQMVPVGCKGSEHKNIEWRVCFILSVQKLTDSWNENQYKIYILLKLIKKSQLKPISDEISSYLMKNIVLWFTEQNPAKIFKKKYLLQNVMNCLRNLQDAIKANHLPFYMLPDRNLLIGRINPEQQQLLIEKLGDLIEEGPRVILRCPKVSKALEMSPAELAKKNRWREKLEKLWLEGMNIWFTYWSLNKEGVEINKEAWRNPHYIRLYDRIHGMVWPQWREYQGDDRVDILKRKVVGVLS